jgi:hypothetical protein
MAGQVFQAPPESDPHIQTAANAQGGLPKNGVGIPFRRVVGSRGRMPIRLRTSVGAALFQDGSAPSVVRFEKTKNYLQKRRCQIEAFRPRARAGSEWRVVIIAFRFLEGIRWEMKRMGYPE